MAHYQAIDVEIIYQAIWKLEVGNSFKPHVIEAVTRLSILPCLFYISAPQEHDDGKRRQKQCTQQYILIQ
jgi:hypothetical protein